ncbi:MAG: MFS transporter [Bacillota bacterium]|nr:MFS transporter [Bacillota bacterium]
MGPLAGAYVESRSKKSIIIGTDIIRGFLALAIAFTANLTTIYILSALSASVAVFFSPAIRTAIPRIVKQEELMTANAMSSMTAYTAMLAGPALAGVMLAAYGAKTAFMINGFSFLFSATTEAFIQIPVSTGEKQPRKPVLWQEIKDGWSYIRETPVVRFVILFFAACMVFFSFTYVLQTVLLVDTFGFAAKEYGTVMSVYGGGMLAGAFFMGKWGQNYHELSFILYGVTLLGIGYFTLALAGSFHFTAAILFVLGLFATVVNVAYGTYLQRAVEDSVRSRVFSMDIAISEVLGVCAMAAAGILGDIFGAAKIILISGLALTLLGIIFLRHPVYCSTTANTPQSA